MNTLLVIDLQNDFCEGGSLAVKDSLSIIPVINRISNKFDLVVQTQDWHPKDHMSFASNNPNKKEYDVIDMEYGKQVLWPNHCVQNTFGSEFHKDLNTQHSHLIIRKGFRKEIDSYSAFYENDKKTTTGLNGYLREMKSTKLYLCGLATDFCVKWSALDAVDEGYEVFLIEDAIKGIDIDNSVELALQEMKQKGVIIISSSQLESHFE